MKIRILVAAALTSMASFAGEVTPSIPDGWTEFPAGGPDFLPGRCVIGNDESITQTGMQNVSIKCDGDEPSYGGIFQTFDAPDFRGKRVRYAALMKTEGVVGSENAEGVATLWMRVEGLNFQQPLFVARLGDRALTGTNTWTPVEIIADIPPNTIRIHIGFIVQAHGQMWVSDLKFEEAPAGSQVTVEPIDPALLTSPRNLGLE